MFAEVLGLFPGLRWPLSSLCVNMKLASGFIVQVKCCYFCTLKDAKWLNKCVYHQSNQVFFAIIKLPDIPSRELRVATRASTSERVTPLRQLRHHHTLSRPSFQLKAGIYSVAPTQVTTFIVRSFYSNRPGIATCTAQHAQTQRNRSNSLRHGICHKLQMDTCFWKKFNPKIQRKLQLSLPRRKHI